MMDITGMLILWLVLLTVAQLAQWFGAVQFRRTLRDTLPQLDYKSELQTLQSTVTRDILKRNADLEHRLIVLIQRLENDPMAHEKHWTDIQSLKNLLK
jgi:hypothetical protein